MKLKMNFVVKMHQIEIEMSSIDEIEIKKIENQKENQHRNHHEEVLCMCKILHHYLSSQNNYHLCLHYRRMMAD